MVPLKVNRNYRFRLYPSRAQEMKLLGTLDSCRCLYNYFLGEWEGKDKIPSRYELQAKLPRLANENPHYANIHSKTRQYVLFQLYSNLKVLSRLKKNGRKVGRLRFKKYGRYKTFVYNQTGFKLIGNGNRYQKLYFFKIGEIPIRAHRKVEGKIKQVLVKRTPSGRWFAILSVETKSERLGTVGKAIGLDLNIENYLTDSNGKSIAHPHALLKLEKNLNREQRKLAKKKNGSKNRLKQKLKVARVHERVTNKRMDFLHKLSTRYISSYDLIAMEDLAVRKMMESSYNAKNTADSSWSTFIQMLSYKAEGAGRTLVKVDPKNTTQNCSKCGNHVYKQIWVRIHKCPACGLVMDRDHNAAINILNKALKEVGSVRPELTPVEMRPLLHLMGGASLVKEAGSSLQKT
ncbi:MAG: transposase [Candidatus Altiarchaeales archaeon]|nr:transposase [Candidatus Altiarchaeota archaeon]MCG2782476.1 transposase [Candidatus Altiarchaeales archaeon]